MKRDPQRAAEHLVADQRRDVVGFRVVPRRSRSRPNSSGCKPKVREGEADVTVEVRRSPHAPVDFVGVLRGPLPTPPRR